MKDNEINLYRRVQVSLLTQLDDGSLLFPDEVAYVKATPKQIAYSHPRCSTCGHFNAENNTCRQSMDLCQTHPLEYCSQHTSLLEPKNEIN